LYINFDQLLATTELRRYREMIQRRAVQREPLQYIVGHTNFYGLTITLNRSVLIPRPETETLAENAINWIRGHGATRVLDIGTGSGCLALAIAKHCEGSEITAIDVSGEALELARKNSELNEVSGVVFQQCDFLTQSIDGSFDVIVSNPPYVSATDFKDLDEELRKHEPSLALTDYADGFTFYRRMAEQFPRLLSTGAKFFVEIGFGQETQVQRIFAGWECMVINDLMGVPRIVSG
jgi:release factor glutamine methyltransferase